MMPFESSIRLLCLYAMCQDLTKSDYEALSKKFFSAYGHKHLLTLNNLKQMGLLPLVSAETPSGNDSFNL